MSKLNTLFAVLNKDIPFGKSLNALAHMCLGMGLSFSEVICNECQKSISVVKI